MSFPSYASSMIDDKFAIDVINEIQNYTSSNEFSFAPYNPTAEMDFLNESPSFKSNRARGRRVHTVDSIDLNLTKSKKLFVCQTEGCSKVFKRAEHLHRHVRMHSGERPFLCTQCEKSFSRSDNLTAHMGRAHNGKRPIKTVVQRQLPTPTPSRSSYLSNKSFLAEEMIDFNRPTSAMSMYDRSSSAMSMYDRPSSAMSMYDRIERPESSLSMMYSSSLPASPPMPTYNIYSDFGNSSMQDFAAYSAVFQNNGSPEQSGPFAVDFSAKPIHFY